MGCDFVEDLSKELNERNGDQSWMHQSFLDCEMIDRVENYDLIWK